MPTRGKRQENETIFRSNISDSGISKTDSVPKNILAFHMDISPRVKEREIESGLDGRSSRRRAHDLT